MKLPSRDGARALPLIDAKMPIELHWNLAHVASGWFSYNYTSEGATPHEQGFHRRLAEACPRDTH